MTFVFGFVFDRKWLTSFVVVSVSAENKVTFSAPVSFSAENVYTGFGRSLVSMIVKAITRNQLLYSCFGSYDFIPHVQASSARNWYQQHKWLSEHIYRSYTIKLIIRRKLRLCISCPSVSASYKPSAWDEYHSKVVQLGWHSSHSTPTKQPKQEDHTKP